MILMIRARDQSIALHREDPELVNIVSKVKKQPTLLHLEQLNLKIRAIWTNKCFSCHSSEKMKADLALDTYEGVLAGGKDGEILIKGHAAKSDIIRRLKLPKGHREAMPSKGEPLTPLQINAIALWIDHGAIWAESSGKLFYEAPLSLYKPKIPPSTSGITHPIDLLVDEYFRKQSKTRWPVLINDIQFIRRVYLDVTGLLPLPEEVELFIADPDPQKRNALITKLLARNEDYTLHWLSFWNDLLRNDYSGPGFITEGRKQISSWLYESLNQDSAYTSMVKSLIHPNPESEGFIQGIAWRGEVNSSQSTEMQAAQNVAQSLLGLNLKCASCHNSFVNNVSLAQSYGFANIFAQKPMEIHRCDAPTGQFAQSQFIYPQLGLIKADSLDDRLVELAAFITKPENGRLYRTMVNRIWHQLFGRGLVANLDDMDQKPWSQEVLDYLAAEFRDQGTSIKGLLQHILTSNTYQLSAQDYDGEENLFSKPFIFKGPGLRKLHAEQVADAISQCIQPMYEGSAFDPENKQLPAFWIWHHYKKFDRTVLPDPGTIYLRKSFIIKNITKIQSAKIIATADHSLKVYLNGTEIIQSQDYRKFRAQDISTLLKTGRNILAVEAGNDGEIAKPAGVLLHARIISEGKDTLHIYSDATWKTTDSLSSTSWTTAGFNDRRWRPAHRYSSYLQSPWGKLIKFNLDGYHQDKLLRASLVKIDPLQLALGRPTRENVTTKRSEEPGLLQSITLNNHPLLHLRIKEGAEIWFSKFLTNPDDLITHLYKSLLIRLPNPAEKKIMQQYLVPYNASSIEDVIWSLIVSPEFQFL